MRKFINEIKTTLGDPEKTKDEEAETLATRLKDAHKACKEHSSAMDGMKKAANDLVYAMDRTAKAFTTTAALNKSEALEALAKEITTMAADAKSNATVQYTAALDKDEAGTKKLNNEIDEARRLEEAREKKMKAYDSARYLVKSKEEEYQKKGKTLDDSKNYKGEVDDRDKKQTEYEDANKAFKEKATAALKDVDDTYLAAMKDYVKATQELFENFQKTVSALKV